MKRIRLMIVAATAVAALAGMQQGAFAQVDKGECPKEMKSGRHDKKEAMNPEERLKRMEKHLGLTTEQKGKIKPILEAEAKEFKALHDDTSLTREQKHEKVKAIRTKYHDQISQILTPEQKAKVEAMREKAKERHEHRQQKGGQKPAPATP